MRHLPSDFEVRGRPRLEALQREREAPLEVAALGINPSSDARLLFEEFAKRFSLVARSGNDGSIRSIRSIAETGGGDRHELAFVLLSLFASNGFRVEKVLVYSDGEADPEDAFELGELEHVLVYLPSTGQYFDPTLRIAKLLNAAWVEERPRVHFPYPSTNKGRGYYGKRVPSEK